MSMTKRECEKCKNSRPIISENGWHYICTLSSKKSLQCMLRKRIQSSSSCAIDARKRNTGKAITAQIVDVVWMGRMNRNDL